MQTRVVCKPVFVVVAGAVPDVEPIYDIEYPPQRHLKLE
jgi:hypothetical protein